MPVDVVAANIEPKLANAFIRQLSQICPLENLMHVKRVRRSTECEPRGSKRPLLHRDVGQDGAERQRAVLRACWKPGILVELPRPRPAGMVLHRGGGGGGRWAGGASAASADTVFASGESSNPSQRH